MAESRADATTVLDPASSGPGLVAPRREVPDKVTGQQRPGTPDATTVVTERRQLFGTFAYLVGHQGSTAILGLAYWVFVTHFFAPDQVGLAFAASSTAVLLSTIGILGIATFLIAELGSTAPSVRRALLSTGMVISGATVGVLAVGALAFSHTFGKSLATIGREPVAAVFFLGGAVATVLAVTFDNAAIAIRRGSAQLTRGILASVLKFACAAALIAAGSRTGAGLIMAWSASLIVSLIVCYPMLRMGPNPPGAHMLHARLGLVRTYGRLSLNHHVLNLSINSVSYLVPVIAAALITTRQYAFYATAQQLTSVVLIVPYLLTLALFAETSDDAGRLQRHVRRTLPMGMAAVSLILVIVELAAPIALGVFGHMYATNGTTALRILILAGPSFVVKDHYVAIRRAQGKLSLASRVLALGTAAEATGAAVGGAAFGLIGLCSGWVLVAFFEGIVLLRPVARVYFGNHSARGSFQLVRSRIPRGDVRTTPAAPLDPGLPVVLLRSPGYPLHHGALGAIRSLGRAGVPVHAVVEDSWTPAARSRYLASRIVWTGTAASDPARLVERLMAVSDALGRPALILCSDDRAAVAMAENAGQLRDRFVLPSVPATLPRRLADKHALFELCREHDVAVPDTRLVTTSAELDRAVDELMFPAVVKPGPMCIAPPGVGPHGTIVDTRDELEALRVGWPEPLSLIVREFLPDECCEDWIVHGYCDGDARLAIVFTGRKLRSWPLRTGATARACVVENPELVALTAHLCSVVGYRGVFDLDWRFDRRTGDYNLLDFNPRLGAQFRMFENEAGIDVARAMHLDLSGRAVPAAPTVEGRQFVVEPFELASLWRQWRQRRHMPPMSARGTGHPSTSGTHLAWTAGDDLLPALVMAVRQVAQSVGIRMVREARSKDRRAPVRRAGSAPGVPVLGPRRIVAWRALFARRGVR